MPVHNIPKYVNWGLYALTKCSISKMLLNFLVIYANIVIVSFQCCLTMFRVGNICTWQLPIFKDLASSSLITHNACICLNCITVLHYSHPKETYFNNILLCLLRHALSANSVIIGSTEIQVTLDKKNKSIKIYSYLIALEWHNIFLYKKVNK